MATLEGADGMDGETSDRRQFLLSEPRCFAKCFELRTKGSRSASLQDSYLTATAEGDLLPRLKTSYCDRCMRSYATQYERRATSVQPVSVVEIRALPPH